MRELPNNDQVKTFFNVLAKNYQERFSSKKPYHAWLFQERLRLASAKISLDQPTILDIGAGTGALFDHLTQQFPSFHYFACDVSKEMLRCSAIPAEQYAVGRVTEVNLPLKSFDYIFILGVTSYMSQTELRETLHFINSHLTPEGRAILSFTNRSSIDWKIRQLIRPLAKTWSAQKSVLSQPFSIAAYRMNEISHLLPDQLRIESGDWFNPLLPPLEKLLPNFWVRMAKRILQNKVILPLRPLLCADFLLTIKKAPC